MLKFARLLPDATTPVRKHAFDAGIDVFAAETVIIWPFSARKVPTGITLDIPPGSAILAWPKGGSDYLLGAGVIDAGYQGEVLIKIVNYKPWPIMIRKGAPIAQLLHQNVQLGDPQEVPKSLIHMIKSDRGASGGIHNHK